MDTSLELNGPPCLNKDLPYLTLHGISKFFNTMSDWVKILKKILRWIVCRLSFLRERIAFVVIFLMDLFNDLRKNKENQLQPDVCRRT